MNTLAGTQPTDVAILALRLGLALILYTFMLVVLRAARGNLANAEESPPLPHAEPDRLVPRSARSAAPDALRLLVVDAGQTGWQRGYEVSVPSGATVGRGGRAGVRVPDSTVSTEHALIQHSGSKWVVRDLRSTNGTGIGEGELLPSGGESPIEAGDILTLGDVRFRVVG